MCRASEDLLVVGVCRGASGGLVEQCPGRVEGDGFARWGGAVGMARLAFGAGILGGIDKMQFQVFALVLEGVRKSV
jgi:hypothetical protein